MNLVWSGDFGVTISDTVSCKYVGMQLFVYGSGIVNERPFTYEATVTSHGWHIALHPWGEGKRGEVQGTTFNLPLEVASAVRRIL